MTTHFDVSMFPSRCDIYVAANSDPTPGPMGTRSRNLPASPSSSAPVPCSWQEATPDEYERGARSSLVDHLVYIRVVDLRGALGLDESTRINEAIPQGSKLVVDGESLLVVRCRDEGGLGVLARVECRERG